MGEEVIHHPKVEVHHGESVPMILSVSDRLDVDMIVFETIARDGCITLFSGVWRVKSCIKPTGPLLSSRRRSVGNQRRVYANPTPCMLSYARVFLYCCRLEIVLL